MKLSVLATNLRKIEAYLDRQEAYLVEAAKEITMVEVKKNIVAMFKAAGFKVKPTSGASSYSPAYLAIGDLKDYDKKIASLLKKYGFKKQLFWYNPDEELYYIQTILPLKNIGSDGYDPKGRFGFEFGLDPNEKPNTIFIQGEF